MASSNSKDYLKHRDERIKKVRARQKMLSEQGLCIICGEKADPGYKRCPKHLKKVREINRRHDEYKYANNICKGCNKPLKGLPAGTLRYCGDCAVKQFESCKKSKYKLKEYDRKLNLERREM